MRLAQVKMGESIVVVATPTNATVARVVLGVSSIYTLAVAAINEEHSLEAEINARGLGEPVDLNEASLQGRIVAPIGHSDPAHVLVSGTGLTHLGSAAGRAKMHQSAAGEVQLTDSMRMFELGVKGGKPTTGHRGVQPEWFYKGDGSIVADPGTQLTSPAFALDAGEEPEITGIYVISDGGQPFRIGFALGNDFSDHVTEKMNYLYLAHSKLRACAVGPEILVGDLPPDVRGSSRIVRGGQIVWERPFVSGESNMCHSIRNLEEHHFKYAAFRRPADVHIHFFGTATLSFSEGFTTEPEDVFEIAAEPFGLPLRNSVVKSTDEFVHVRSL